MNRTPYQQSLHDFRQRLEAAVEADTSRWSTVARRVLAEHGEKDSRCVRCVAHPASTDHWIGVGVGASYPCPSVLAVAWGYDVAGPAPSPSGGSEGGTP